MYALVRTGGKQYRVSKDDTILVERIAADEGSEVILDDVVMLGDGDKVTIGTPRVEGAAVSATVMRQTRGPKIVIFRRKRRKEPAMPGSSSTSAAEIGMIAEDGKSLKRRRQKAAPEPEARQRPRRHRKSSCQESTKAEAKKAAPKAEARRPGKSGR